MPVSSIKEKPTSRAEKNLNIYLNNLDEIEPLDRQEEVELAKSIKSGDQLALDRLVKANLRFVVSVAKQYVNQGLSFNDLINEGNVGLVTAAYRFDETKGFKFITYAVWWIRRTILEALAQQSSTVNLTSYKKSLRYSIRKGSNILEQELGRNPAESEIADRLDFTEEQITDSHMGGYISLNQPFSQTNESTFLDLLEDENQKKPDEICLDNSLNEEVVRALDKLSKRESEIVKLYFGIGFDKPHTLEEIGTMFGLSRERVRQIKERVIKKLQHPACATVLEPYLE